MPKNNWGDLSSIDYRSLPLPEREEFLREAVRRAHAARTAQIAAIVSVTLRLIRGLVARLTLRKGARRVTIPGRTLTQV